MRNTGSNPVRSTMIKVNCNNCEKEIEKRRDDVSRSKTNLFYCDRRCAAITNNRNHPKRNPSLCHCGEKKVKRNKQCSDCVAKEKDRLLDLPMSHFFAGEGAAKFTGIRGRARKVYYASNDKICKICGYSRHIHVSHIKGLADFDDSTPLRTVNHIDNLIGLCSNCHWEVDNGMTKI